MTASPEEREQFAMRSLDTAAEWRRKGDARRELTTLGSAVKTLLGVAVERFADTVAGTQFLHRNEAGQLLGRMAELNQGLHEALCRDGKPSAGSVNNQITPVHIAWLLECWNSGKCLLGPCVDEAVRKFFPLTAFWAEYHRAIDCLAANRPYEPVIPRTRGYEQYWIPYLKLVAELTTGRPVATVRAEMAESFAKRNRDKRLTDWEMIDGDGKHPVRWDFREASILSSPGIKGLVSIQANPLLIQSIIRRAAGYQSSEAMCNHMDLNSHVIAAQICVISAAYKTSHWGKQ